MNRRDLLRGLLALPVMAALAPLLPKVSVPAEVIAAAPVTDFGPLYYLTNVSFVTTETTNLAFKINDRMFATFGPNSGYSVWNWTVDPPIAVRSKDSLSLVSMTTGTPVQFNASWVEA